MQKSERPGADSHTRPWAPYRSFDLCLEAHGFEDVIVVDS